MPKGRRSKRRRLLTNEGTTECTNEGATKCTNEGVVEPTPISLQEWQEFEKTRADFVKMQALVRHLYFSTCFPSSPTFVPYGITETECTQMFGERPSWLPVDWSRRSHENRKLFCQVFVSPLGRTATCKKSVLKIIAEENNESGHGNDCKPHRKYHRWTKEETNALVNAYDELGPKWQFMANTIPELRDRGGDQIKDRARTLKLL
eukprot:Rmarinus@m.18444